MTIAGQGCLTRAARRTSQGQQGEALKQHLWRAAGLLESGYGHGRPASWLFMQGPYPSMSCWCMGRTRA